MNLKPVIKLHFIFWSIMLAIPVLLLLTYTGNPNFPLLFVYTLAIFPRDIISFYFFHFTVTQKFFSRKGLIKTISLLIVYISVFSIIYTIYAFYVYKYVFVNVRPTDFTISDWFNDNIYEVIARNLIFSILGCLSKVSLILYKNQVIQKEAEKQNISNELAMLRAQVNPHFLFNTLNNIKSLVMDIPAKAVYSTGKLIDIMNYMLYESSSDSVPFENEIKYINNYLDLERIRFFKPDYIDFKISGDYSNILIPPLIFMPFIENTFKHGDKLKPSPGIVIKFDVSKTKISFEIKNYIKENYVMHNKKSGFGLANIKRRLDLLFENKYELSIKNENNIFLVNLNLNIL